jgi:hypothetical protein
MIKSKGPLLLASLATLHQAKLIEELCILGALRHVLSLCPFTTKHLRDLDAERAKYLKPIFGLPLTAPNDVCFLSTPHQGLGCTSLTTEAARVAAETFTTSHNDLGRLGLLHRCLTACHLHEQPSGSVEPQPSLQTAPAQWLDLPNAMNLRKAALLRQNGMSVSIASGGLHPALPNTKDLHHLVFDALQTNHFFYFVVDVIQHVLAPLWALHIHHPSQLTHTDHLIDSAHLLTQFPHATTLQRSALNILTHILCPTLVPHRRLPSIISEITPDPLPLAYRALPWHLQPPASRPPTPPLPVMKAYWHDIDSVLRIDACDPTRPMHPCCLVSWRPSIKWTQPALQTALHLGYKVKAVLQTSPKRDAQGQPLWQSITWQDSWEPIPYVWRYWPGKADATLARDWQASNTPHPDMPTARDPRQLCRGIDPAPHLTPLPPHMSTHPITLSTTEVNPDVDIHPTDTCELYITATHAYSYTPTGRCTESLSLSCCQKLFRDFHPQSTTTPFSEAVPNLLQRCTRTHGHMDTEQTLLDRPLLPTVLHTALVTTFKIQNEWLSTPLLHHPLVAQYASPHAADALFTAIPGC